MRYIFSPQGEAALARCRRKLPDLVIADGELPGLDGEVALQWDANVSRVTRAALQTCWQQGQRLAGGVVSAWEQAQPRRSGAIARWQEARPLAAGARTHWQESVRHRALVRNH